MRIIKYEIELSPGKLHENGMHVIKPDLKRAVRGFPKLKPIEAAVYIAYLSNFTYRQMAHVFGKSRRTLTRYVANGKAIYFYSKIR